MRNYCKCENKSDTYRSVAGDTCCGNCFTAIKPVEVEAKKITIIEVIEKGQNYLVVKNGETVEAFNKLAEDYAYTLATGLANRLRRALTHNERKE